MVRCLNADIIECPSMQRPRTNFPGHKPPNRFISCIKTSLIMTSCICMTMDTTSLDATSPTRMAWKVWYEHKFGILWILVFEKEKKKSRRALTWSSLTNTRARICKHVWSPEIDSDESVPPGWESIPGLLKLSTIRA